MKKNVVMWGHTPSDGNTLRFPWASYAKAWRHFGYDTVQVPDTPESAEAVTPDSIVFAEGQEDKHLPRRKDVLYILHNCDWSTYDGVGHNRLALQVYSYDVHEREVHELEPFVYHQPVPGCFGILYQPWATDLLPDEIDREAVSAERKPESVWVGTIGGGRFGNTHQIAPWMQACTEKMIQFRHVMGVSEEEARVLIRDSYLTPIIVGEWQAKNGYVPCRAFKNVSYGQPPLTNSKAVRDIFGSLAVFNENPYALFRDGAEYIQTLRWQMYGVEALELVRARHTFVNRIQAVLRILGQ